MPRVFCVGHAVQDLVFTVDEMPGAAEKYRAKAFETVGGGPAATAAVAVARLGGEAMLAARVGDDRSGESIIEELEHYGVDCRFVWRLAGRTSSTSVAIVAASGERLIVNYLDPNMETEVDWLPQRLPADVDAVLCDTRWPEGSLHMLRLARAAGVHGVLDADLPVPADGELLRHASHVAFSAAGLADYSGEQDPEIALRSVARRIDAWCCVTLGGQGALSVHNGETTSMPAFAVAVSDTLGAGDVWHGAFALALAEQSEVFEAMRFAAAAAALKVANGGGRLGTPDRQAVDALLSQHQHGIDS